MMMIRASNPDKYFAGFLAGLKLVHPERLTGNRTAFNRAFYTAVNSPSGQFFQKAALDIDFDPLYGVSPWFERQLTRAQSDLLISFPNPSYSAVDIKLNGEQAERLLAQFGEADQFKALAREFVSLLTSPR